MARVERDREDLLREAKALVQRVEIRTEGVAESVVAGFRRDGSATFYFGMELVFQFNSACELRRGFQDGRLLVAEKRRLVALTRQRSSGDEVALVRHLLDRAEHEQFLQLMDERLCRLADSLRNGKFSLIGQVPQDEEVLDRVQSWLAALARPVRIANRPHVGGT